MLGGAFVVRDFRHLAAAEGFAGAIEEVAFQRVEADGHAVSHLDQRLAVDERGDRVAAGAQNFDERFVAEPFDEFDLTT